MADVTPELVRLARLVRAMRNAQIRVISKRDRSPRAIATVRDFEARVDKAVAWIDAHQPRGDRQAELFEKPERPNGAYRREGGRDGR